jgi:hypothetical protein
VGELNVQMTWRPATFTGTSTAVAGPMATTVEQDR